MKIQLKKSYLVIIFIVTILLSCFLIFDFIHGKIEFSNCKQTEGILISNEKEIKTLHKKNKRKIKYHNIYEYEVNGKNYTYKIDGSSTNSLGSKITIYYLPENPSKAIDDNWNRNSILAIIVSLFLSVLSFISIIKYDKFGIR